MLNRNKYISKINFIKIFIILAALSCFMLSCKNKIKNSRESDGKLNAIYFTPEQEQEFKEYFYKKYAGLTEEIIDKAEGAGDLILEGQSSFLTQMRMSFSESIKSGKLARVQIRRIREINKLDNEAKRFIEDLFLHKDTISQLYAIPILLTAYQHAPDARDWVKEEVMKQISENSGTKKKSWKKVLSLLD